jgi:hypothetical protein
MNANILFVLEIIIYLLTNKLVAYSTEEEKTKRMLFAMSGHEANSITNRLNSFA